MLVEPHENHFESTEDDEVWLGELSKRGWVGITKDKKIRLSDLALSVIRESGAKVFFCIGQYSHAELAENVVRSRHRMDRWVRKYDFGFIARLYMAPEPKHGRQKRGAGDLKFWPGKDYWISPALTVLSVLASQVYCCLT